MFESFAWPGGLNMLKVEEKDAVKGLLCVMQLDDKIWYRAQVLI